MTGPGPTAVGDTAPADERFRRSGDEAGTAPGDRTFRPDVQGLRAVAVLLVVLFHAHVPGLGGGYVGVDVFFVISGFVITGLLLRERASTGSTSILGFYGRRVRRIIPAATLVIIVAVVASYVALGPLTGNQTAVDARWASVFLINIHFASTGTNYLSATLPPSVLQNYWSLAVEEQFYLVYPAIFLAVAALSRGASLRRRLALVLGAAVVVSFVLSVVQTRSNPTAAYFSPLPRVWELALGGLVALGTTTLQRIPARVAAALSWIGLAGILVAAFAFTASTPYPGSAVALPVLGTALVIAGGVARPQHGAETVLGLRPFQWLGLISYSLYLWHWPVLTIAAQRSNSGTLSLGASLWWLLLSVVLAVLTYRLLENPIRHSRLLSARRWTSLALGGCLIASSLTVATVELHLHPQAALATPGLENLKTGAACPGPTRQGLQALLGTGPKAAHKVVARILLVGDSTSCTMLPGLEAVAEPAGVKVENGAVIGCGVVSGELAPLYNSNGVNVNAPSSTCQRRADAAEARALRGGRPNVVLWGSVWERAPLLVGNGPHKKALAAGSPEWYTVLRERMEARIKRFTSTGATVVLLTQAPFATSVPTSKSTDDDKAFARLNGLLTQIASSQPKVRIIDLADHVCPGGPPCPLVVDGIGIRGDGAHYASDGSLWVARWLLPQLGIAALDKPSTALPLMRMILPKSGSTVHGTTTLAALASFIAGVSGVEFEVSEGAGPESVIGSAVLKSGLWVLPWDSASVPNGNYTVRSVAENAAGATSPGQAITVKVQN